MKHTKRSTKRGYTLVEMLIVLSIISVIFPVVFSILYILLNQQVKLYRIIETKRQGDRIMSFMKEKISREAVVIKNAAGTPRCDLYTGIPETTADGNDFIFRKSTDPLAPSFNFYVTTSTLLTQDSAGLPSTSLHDNRVRITNFQIECFRRNNTISPAQPNKHVIMVGFSYTVEFIDNTPTQAEGTTSLQYHTKIRLR